MARSSNEPVGRGKRDCEQFNIWVPRALKKKIRIRALAEDRTMNDVALAALYEHMGFDPRASAEEERRLDGIVREGAEDTDCHASPTVGEARAALADEGATDALSRLLGVDMTGMGVE